MAINKKLIFWNKRSNFSEPTSSTDTTGSVLWHSIVFFNDTREIWTHGVYFSGLTGTLTGYTVGSNSALSSSDTILSAFGKIQGQLNSKQNTLQDITGLQGTYTKVKVNSKGLVTEGFNPTTLNDFGITDGALKTNSLYYVEGNTSGTAGQWTATIPEVTSLYPGLSIAYKIGIAGTTTTNLNVNGFGNNVVRRNTGNLTTHLPVGTVVILVFDGTFWVWADYNVDTIDRTAWFTTITAGSTINAYKILMQGLDGKFYPLTLEAGTGTSKTISTQEFQIGSQILYYATTAVVSTNGTTTKVYSEIPLSTLAHTDNRTSWLSQRPIYIKGSVLPNGNFKLDNSSPTSFLTQTLPNNEDGYIYIMLGYFYSTTAMRLFQYHPIYEYKNGGIRLYCPEHSHGNITNDGKIGSTPNLPVLTGSGGTLVAKSAGTASQYLNGLGQWATPNDTTYSQFVGGTISTNGSSGLVPAPTTSNYNYFLKGTGVWAQINYSDLTGTVPTWNQNTTGNAASSTYASAVTLTSDNSTNADRYPLFASSVTGNLSPRTSVNFKYNPSTGALTAASFIGNIAWSNILNKPTTLSGYGITDAQIKNKVNTESQWSSTNPILSSGEIGIVSDVSPVKIKIGDGVTAWNSLADFKISKTAIESVLTGEITTHTHPGGASTFTTVNSMANIPVNYDTVYINLSANQSTVSFETTLPPNFKQTWFIRNTGANINLNLPSINGWSTGDNTQYSLLRSECLKVNVDYVNSMIRLKIIDQFVTMELGDILCSDGTTVKPNEYLTSGKVGIAVAVTGIRQRLEPSRAEKYTFYVGKDEFIAPAPIQWKTNPHLYFNYHGSQESVLQDYQSDYLTDRTLYLSTGASSDASSTYVMNTYTPSRNTYQWQIPTVGEMRNIISNLGSVNSSLSLIGGAPITIFSNFGWNSSGRYGTSSFGASNSPWYLRSSNGYNLQFNAWASGGNESKWRVILF